MKRYDIIISGAGPVGLFLACELAMRECSVLVLERAEIARSPLKKMPFGLRGLSAPSIEALDRRGLLNDLELHKRLKNPHMNAGVGARRQVGHFAGIPFYEGDVDTSEWKNRLPSSTPNSLMSELEEIETILSARARKLGVEINYGLPVIDFRQNADGVTARSSDQSFEAKWLVGCDGARSVVRKVGGFEFAGTEPEFTGYTALIDIENPDKLKPGRNLTASGMYMQSQPGYVMIQDFDGGAFHGSGAPISREHIQDVLRKISETDIVITQLHVATTWTDRARQATQYRIGRVLLAGDAAHIHSPLGGQGLNLGLGDAMNLGWKLAATLHGKAPQGLLESYETERRPIGKRVLEWSRAQVAIMKPGATARALNSVVRDLMNTQDGATYFAARVWGIHTRYDLGDAHPLVGQSVPNFEFDDGTTIGALMREGQGLLLDFSENQALANVSAKNLQYITGRAKEQLGLKAVLVRPDGIVTWASEGDSDIEALKQRIKLWFDS